MPIRPDGACRREKLRNLKRDELPGVELQLFENWWQLWPIAHTSFSLGCVLDEDCPVGWRCGTKHYELGASSVCMVEPGVLTRVGRFPRPTRFCILLVEPQVLSEAFEVPSIDRMRFGGAQVDSLETRRRFCRLIDDFGSDASPLQVESDLYKFLRLDVISQLGEAESKMRRPRVQNAIRLISEYLQDNWQRNVSLDECSRLVSMSKFHLHRSFVEHFGVSPHQYQIALRLGRARQLLGMGRRPAEVAHLTGFSNHPHLTRVFLREVGVLPREYARSVSKAHSEA